MKFLKKNTFFFLSLFAYNKKEERKIEAIKRRIKGEKEVAIERVPVVLTPKVTGFALYVSPK